jgi:peroxiredoxin
MRNILFISIATLFFSACKPDKPVIISGTIKDGGGVILYFEKILPEKKEIIDSTIVASDGTFAIRTPAKEITYYQLRLGKEIQTLGMGAPMNVIVLITDSTERITLTAEKDKFAVSYEVSGSTESEKYRELMRMTDEVRETLGKHGKKMRSAINEEEREQFAAEFADLQNNFRTKYREWITQHSGMFVTLQALSMLDPELNFAFLKETSETLYARYSSNPFVSRLMEKVAELEKVAIGSIAKDFKLPTVAGDTVSLFRFLEPGKMLFVDFWASWCRPCRQENPQLVALHNRFKQSVTFLGVSLDENRNAWEQAIKQDGLTWVQLSDLAGWNAGPARLYNISAIPANLILDENGTILARNLRSNELEAFFQKSLK